MRRLKLIGFASKFMTRNFSSNGNYVGGGRRSLINHHTRLCSYRYVAGIAAAKQVVVVVDVDDGVFSFSPFRRFFHATGPLFVNERNYYDILGVSKDADRDEIKKSFHKLAKKYHPDTNKNNPSAKKKFQELRDAYETLQDPDKRSVYDMSLETGPIHGSGRWDAKETHFADTDAFTRAYKTHFSSSFHRIFSEIFENKAESLAADVQAELSLSFQEAAKGCEKTLSYDAYRPCYSCHGRGHPVDPKTTSCPACEGLGKVTIPPFSSTCSTCKGSGRIITQTCRVCEATGVLEGNMELTVTIPPGVDSGDTITLPKAGNFRGLGAEPGNLYIKVKVADDSIFTRNGADVYVDVSISFTQALLGGKVEVPTLSENISLDIPKGVQPGQIVVLRGRGLPKYGLFIKRGDQHIVFRVTFPAKVNERQKAILEEFEMEEMNREDSFSEESWWQRIFERGSSPKLLLEVSILLLILLFVKKILV